MIQVVAGNPYLLSQFDTVKMFQQWARVSGAKNVNDFILKTDQRAKVMQDQQLMSQVEAGNMIPMSEAENVAR